MKKRIAGVFIAIMMMFTFGACTIGGGGGKAPSSTLDYEKGQENYEGTHDYKEEDTGAMMVDNKSCAYKIVYPMAADDNVMFAVAELTHFFKLATGIELEQVSDEGLAYDATSTYLSIGNTSILSTANLSPDYSILGVGGLKVVTVGKSIFMYGATSTGSINAVYEFLAKAFNYEIFAENTIRINKNVENVKLMKYDITDVPDYQYISSNYGIINNNATLRSRLRMIRDKDLIIPVGGIINHNSFKWLPKATYQANHPTWYSKDGTQLCYYAQGDDAEFKIMLDTITAEMKKYLIADATRNFITLTHEDTQTWCTCDTCTKSKNTYNGANSAGVIKLLNQVKDNIDAWFLEEAGAAYKRDLKIFFFGYHQTNKPPVNYDKATDKYSPVDDSVTCRPGVAVYFAETNGDYTQNLQGSNNAEIASNFRGWGAITHDIFFWSYQTNFTHYLTPYNSFNGMQDIYKFGVKCNSILLFDQGQFNETATPTAWGMLKIYLSYKLAWNVNLDFNQLINEFFENYFGPAADSMMEMFDSFRVRAQYNEQYNGYNGSRSVFINALQTKFWPKSTLFSWIGSIEKALNDIKSVETTSPSLYETYKSNIILERISPVYMLVEMYSSAFTPTELLDYKKMCYQDANLVGMSKESEKKAIADLYKRWGLV